MTGVDVLLLTGVNTIIDQNKMTGVGYGLYGLCWLFR